MTVVYGTLTRIRSRSVSFVATESIATPRPVARRPAKVARMLALAHHIQGAIDRGIVADRAAVARQLGFTRAKVTQLLDLILLAPNIQDELLGMEAVAGIEPLSERKLRELVREPEWGRQRKIWGGLLVGSAR
jgi:hypothetical protein